MPCGTGGGHRCRLQCFVLAALLRVVLSLVENSIYGLM